MVALDDSAARFPNDPRVPGWLYAAGIEGVAQAYFYPRSAPDSAFFRALPLAFEFREIAGSRYTGWHLFELLGRFPTDSLADDAAYLVAQRRGFRVWDCEGWLYCYLEASVRPWTDFLSGRPESSLAPAALANADSLIGDLFDELAAGRLKFEALDSLVPASTDPRYQQRSIETTLRELELSSRRLAEPTRSMARERLESIQARWEALKARP